MRHIMHQGQLGHAIRILRQNEGLTQQELAAKAGVGRVWLSRAERGKPTVQIDQVFKVLNALGKTVNLEDKPPDLLEVLLG